jgi:DnaJ-class molecular chaperone
MNIEDKLKLLNVSKDSSLDEIKKAFRKRILECHPDKKNGSNTEFINLKNAYDDVIKWKTASVNFYILFSIYISYFKNILFSRAKDIQIKVEIHILELYNNETKKIKYSRKTKDGMRIETLFLELKDWKEEYVIPGYGDYDVINDITTDLKVEICINYDGFNDIHINTCLNLYELYMIIEINLFEYFYGVSRNLKYLDNEVLVLKFNPYESRCDSQTIHGKGLESEGVRKDLIILYKLDLSNVENIEEHYTDIKRIFGDKIITA